MAGGTQGLRLLLHTRETPWVGLRKADVREHPVDYGYGRGSVPLPIPTQSVGTS